MTDWFDPTIWEQGAKATAALLAVLAKLRDALSRRKKATHISQYGSLTVRTSEDFHDRFMILDDKEFYHCGASLEHAGRRGFMFSRLEEPSVLSVPGKRISAEWQKAKVID